MSALRRRVVAFLLALCLVAPAAAGADSLPASYTVISGITAVVVKTGAGTFYGALSTGVQTNVLTCYDNTAASGTILDAATIATVGGSLSGIPASGIQFSTGLTCQVPTAIVGTVVILWK